MGTRNWSKKANRTVVVLIHCPRSQKTDPYLQTELLVGVNDLGSSSSLLVSQVPLSLSDRKIDTRSDSHM